MKTSIFKVNKADFEFSAPPARLYEADPALVGRLQGTLDSAAGTQVEGKGDFPRWLGAGWTWEGGESKDTGIYGS